MLNIKEIIKTPTRQLSLGQRMRCEIAAAFLHNPKIVFLDEPTGGIDPITRRKFWELIYDAANEGVTVFVTTHYMDEAEYCDRISIMVDGHIAALDSHAALKKQFNAENIDQIFTHLARGAKRTAD